MSFDTKTNDVDMQQGTDSRRNECEGETPDGKTFPLDLEPSYMAYNLYGHGGRGNMVPPQNYLHQYDRHMVPTIHPPMGGWYHQD